MGFAANEVEKRVMSALDEVELAGLEKKSVHNLTSVREKGPVLQGF